MTHPSPGAAARPLVEHDERMDGSAIVIDRQWHAYR